MGKPVVHFEVIGRDGKALQEFYGKVFDWTIHADNPMNYGLVHTEAGTGIDGGIGQGDENLVIFYVEVDDPQAYLDKVEQLGGKVVAPVTEISGMVTFAQFTAPRAIASGS